MAAYGGRDRLALLPLLRERSKPRQDPRRSRLRDVHAGVEGAVGAISTDVVTPGRTGPLRALTDETTHTPTWRPPSLRDHDLVAPGGGSAASGTSRPKQ